MANLSTKSARIRLKIRREPHWQRLQAGAYLGFRRGPDTWIARFRGRDGGQQYNALGEALEYDEAKKLAEAWLAQLAASPVRIRKRGTVREALEGYMGWLTDQGRPRAAAEALWRYKCTVWDAPLAGIKLEKVQFDDFDQWRKGLQEGRLNRSVNRHVRAVVAGLNRALKIGFVGNPAAWALDPLADDTEEEGTAVFLSAEQRAALIAAAEERAGRFFRGLELTGARPGELAAATVADWSGDTLKLSHRKGRPPKLRVRTVILSADGARFFKEQAKGKLPAAFLFTDANNEPWRAHYWARKFREAAASVNAKARGKARIPAAASAYSFRHARISELLQVHGVDPLTVAHQCGTSLVMIEKAYYRSIASAMREKLAELGGKRKGKGA